MAPAQVSSGDQEKLTDDLEKMRAAYEMAERAVHATFAAANASAVETLPLPRDPSPTLSRLGAQLSCGLAAITHLVPAGAQISHYPTS